MNFQFDNFQAFLSMAGHGPYVWGAYVVSLALVVGLVVSPLVSKRRLFRQLGRQIAHKKRLAQTDTTQREMTREAN